MINSNNKIVNSDKTCQNCISVLAHGNVFHCAHSYFLTPPIKRKPINKKFLPIVSANYFCHNWGCTYSSLRNKSKTNLSKNSNKLIYYLPDDGELIHSNFGEYILSSGYDLFGRETIGNFRSIGFDSQILKIVSDLSADFSDKDLHIVAHSYGAYLLLHALVHLGTSFEFKITLLSPILGPIKDSTSLLNFIPPKSDRLFQLANFFKFPILNNCRIYIIPHCSMLDVEAISKFSQLTGIKCIDIINDYNELDQSIIFDKFLNY